MSKWIVKAHPLFCKDLDRLGTKELRILQKKKQKIREHPERQKHLGGGDPCYREPITNNIRLIYALEGNTIWLLTIGHHDDAYKDYVKRLRTLRGRLG